MFERRYDERLLPIVLLVVAVAILSFFVVRLIWNAVPSVTTPSITAVQAVPNVSSSNIVETFEYIRFNQQATGLAPNQAIYQASLNYADYPASMYLVNREMAANLLMNQQSAVLPANWALYQASLNYADYPVVAMPADKQTKMDIPMFVPEADADMPLPPPLPTRNEDMGRPF